MAGRYHESHEKLFETSLDLHRARMSLKEEIEAMDCYQQRTRETLKHNRDEAKEHAMLMEWVRRNDPAFAHEMKEYLFTDGKPIADIEESSK